MGLYALIDPFVVGVILLLIFYFGKRPRPKAKLGACETPRPESELDPSRDIVDIIKRTNKNCVVFYGSQTGTAEDYAARLAKEGKSRFGLNTMVADLEEYDYDRLGQLPRDTILIFVLATYGEGEPTDNAVDFHTFITSGELLSADNPSPLRDLAFAAFGLGNSTYEKYNWMVRSVNQALTDLGANRLGVVGEGDDGKGGVEEDFLAWKESMWTPLAKMFGLKERPTVYEPTFAISPLDELTPTSNGVFLGEPTIAALRCAPQGPYNAHNPYLAVVSESYELFSSKDRNCLHMEIDIGDSNFSYTTGDHIAVWPNNPSEEVESLLRILNLWETRNRVVDIKAVDSSVKVPFPTPTTFDALFRYYLEICAPVSRQLCATLASFAPSEEAKERMALLGRDRDHFIQETRSAYFNLASLLARVSRGDAWRDVPHSAVIEGLGKLQPRYYSISSSSLAQPRMVSITAVVESKLVKDQEKPFKGVATNYLLALKYHQNCEVPPESFRLSYQLHGPRNTRKDVRLPIHIRHSHFRLPADSKCPVIMIGPGTGVAPFRAFTQERVRDAEQGQKVGQMLLFFGCRKSSEDLIYAAEWEVSSHRSAARFRNHFSN